MTSGVGRSFSGEGASFPSHVVLSWAESYPGAQPPTLWGRRTSEEEAVERVQPLWPAGGWLKEHWTKSPETRIRENNNNKNNRMPVRDQVLTMCQHDQASGAHGPLQKEFSTGLPLQKGHWAYLGNVDGSDWPPNPTYMQEPSEPRPVRVKSMIFSHVVARPWSISGFGGDRVTLASHLPLWVSPLNAEGGGATLGQGCPLCVGVGGVVRLHVPHFTSTHARPVGFPVSCQQYRCACE